MFILVDIISVLLNGSREHILAAKLSPADA